MYLSAVQVPKIVLKYKYLSTCTPVQPALALDMKSFCTVFQVSVETFDTAVLLGVVYGRSDLAYVVFREESVELVAHEIGSVVREEFVGCSITREKILQPVDNFAGGDGVRHEHFREAAVKIQHDDYESAVVGCDQVRTLHVNGETLPWFLWFG